VKAAQARDCAEALLSRELAVRNLQQKLAGGDRARWAPIAEVMADDPDQGFRVASDMDPDRPAQVTLPSIVALLASTIAVEQRMQAALREAGGEEAVG
jgi:hypothetical protein